MSEFLSEASLSNWRSQDRPAGISLDPEFGVLRIELMGPKGVVEAEFDDQEIFVFTDTDTGQTVGFEVHSFLSYWMSRKEALVDHLSKYCPEQSGTIQSLLFDFTGATMSGTVPSMSSAAE